MKIIERDVLKFLFNEVKGKSYLSIITDEIFTKPSYQTLYTLLRNFHKKYHKYPNKQQMTNYLETALKKSKQVLSDEQTASLYTTLAEAYSSMTGSSEYVEDQIVFFYKKQKLTALISKSAAGIKNATVEDIDQMITSFGKLRLIGANASKIQGTSFVEDYRPNSVSFNDNVLPTYLKGLNALTALGGFFSPQLIIVMMPPKKFKTGTLLNLARGFVSQGKKVYYPDTENTHGRILDRFKQSLVNCTTKELIEGKYEAEIAEIMLKIKAMGGEFKTDFFLAKRYTMGDVDERLELLGYKPDVIIFDGLDNFLPMNQHVKDRRLQIQEVYFDAAALLEKYEAVGLTPSQAKREAFMKATLSASDIAEDAGKIANAHGVFALCADAVEERAGIGRIVPVAQRDGVDPSTNQACFVRLDKKIMLLEEISKSEWYRIYGQFEGPAQNGKQKEKSLREQILAAAAGDDLDDIEDK